MRVDDAEQLVVALEWPFFHKIMVAEKFFLQMHNTILQRVK